MLEFLLLPRVPRRVQHLGVRWVDAGLVRVAKSKSWLSNTVSNQNKKNTVKQINECYEMLTNWDKKKCCERKIDLFVWFILLIFWCCVRLKSELWCVIFFVTIFFCFNFLFLNFVHTNVRYKIHVRGYLFCPFVFRKKDVHGMESTALQQNKNFCVPLHEYVNESDTIISYKTQTIFWFEWWTIKKSCNIHFITFASYAETTFSCQIFHFSVRSQCQKKNLTWSEPSCPVQAQVLKFNICS